MNCLTFREPLALALLLALAPAPGAPSATTIKRRPKKTSDRAGASEQYKYAFEYYLFARFPLENSSVKAQRDFSSSTA